MNIEKIGNAGIKCDNPTCDFTDKTKPDELLAEWLNVSCPKCGENLLTQEDLDSSVKLDIAFQFVNSLSIEQLKSLSEGMGINPEAFDGLSPEVTVDVHNGVRFEFKEKE